MSSDTKDNKTPEVSLNTTSLTYKSNTFESGLLLGAGKGKEIADKNVIASNALEFEDDFSGLYNPSESNNGNVFIQPPFNPLVLEKLVKNNNTLGPCIEAMRTNIDGTGYEIIHKSYKKVPDNKKDKVDSKLEILRDFFAEPWPGSSFTTIRKDLRADLENIGYGFLEVIRNGKGDIVFIRHLQAKTMRLLKLDNSRTVERRVTRQGVTRTIKVKLRFRRFVQKIGSSLIYFKEFQAPTDLNKETGKWVTNKKLSIDKKASEIIYFTLDKDINTPYGLPRWISQMPSILGSRQAEENNLSFFNSGGIPPFILIVQGGVLAQETKEALEKGLMSNTDVKQRGLVIEAHSTSGSLDDKSDVKVQVEKFGSDKQKDSQFENYDTKCSQRIRSAFRLPPAFLGQSSEYNFASLFASYIVGEAQIFKPERDEFDEIITLKLIPEIIGEDSKGYQFRSLPAVVNDVKEKIMAIKTASDKNAISPEETVRNLNEVTGLEMVATEAKSFLDSIPEDTDSINEGITSDSSLLNASTSSSTEPQGSSDVKLTKPVGTVS